MTETANKGRFELVAWNRLRAKRGGYRVASRKKRYWIVAASKSRAIWYSTVLANLTGQPPQGESATIADIRAALSAGLKRNAFDRFKQIANVTAEDLGRAVNIKPRTLSRRETFELDESERLLRVASAFQKAVDVFGDLDKARRWFSTPRGALGGLSPLEFCNTAPGAEEVEDLLGRLEHGIFP